MRNSCHKIILVGRLVTVWKTDDVEEEADIIWVFQIVLWKHGKRYNESKDPKLRIYAKVHFLLLPEEGSKTPTDLPVQKLCC